MKYITPEEWYAGICEQFPHVVSVPHHVQYDPHMCAWCEQHIGDQGDAWYNMNPMPTIRFKTSEQAMQFTLVWL